MQNAHALVVLAEKFAAKNESSGDAKEKDEFSTLLVNMGIANPVKCTLKINIITRETRVSPYELTPLLETCVHIVHTSCSILNTYI